MAQSHLRIPKRNPKTLRRPRLLDHLHNNAHRKLSFVCAPAGYGKTTLLVDFSEDIDGDIYWYRITEEDILLDVFFEKIILSFRTNVPGFGENLLGSTLGRNQSPKVLATAFVNAIDQSVGKYSFLILDDYHTVSHCPEIVEFLDHLLEILPDQLRVVIGSRSVYGIPTAALYVQDQLAVIGTAELAFRPDELKDLCSQYYQINLTEDQTNRIIQESEGWIVAILLALRSESSTIEIPKIVGAREHIYHYLANEVVSALPDYLKEFMFATSTVEEFSAPLANHLMEIDQAARIIQELEELNLFLSDTGSGSEVIYRYHQLFSDFLVQHLGENQDPDIKKYHSRAAVWYQDHQNPEKAVTHYCRAGEIECAANVVDQSAQKYYISGQIQTLKHWHKQLGDQGEMTRLTPILLLSMAKYEITQGEFATGSEYLELSEEPLLERKDFSNYVNWLVTRGMLYRFTGRFQEALRSAEQAQELVEEHRLNRMYWNQAERLKGIVSYYLRNFEDAFRYLGNAAAAFREAMEAGSLPDQTHDLMMTLADIGHFGIEQGRILDTQKSFREAVELTKRIPGNYTDIAIAYNNYAYLYYKLGDYEKAWRNYAQGIEATKIYHLDRFRVHIMNGQADVLREIGEHEDARKLYEEVIELAEQLKENNALVDAYSGLIEVETETGFFNKALYYVREVARVKDEELAAAGLSARFGKVYLAMGQWDLGRQSLESAILSWGDHPRAQQYIVDAYYHYAIVLFRLSEEEKAVEYLNRTFEMAAALGYDQFLVVSARNHKRLLEQISERWDSPQLGSVIKRAGQVWIKRDQLETPIEEIKLVESSLQVIAFGKEAVRLDGEIIQNTKWHSVGARAMFFFILDSKEVTKEQIALEFWPDFSPGKVNSNFHATLWRVRNALGGKQMIQYHGDTYRVNPEVRVHYDVEQFEHLLSRLSKNTSDIEQRILLRQIVELYQGAFLLSIDMSWADRRRIELHGNFIHALSSLARLELERDNFAEAAEHLNRLVELEPYRDDFHREKMACMVGMGNVNGARQYFRDYREFLIRELGIEPDLEITEFFNNL